MSIYNRLKELTRNHKTLESLDPDVRKLVNEAIENDYYSKKLSDSRQARKELERQAIERDLKEPSIKKIGTKKEVHIEDAMIDALRSILEDRRSPATKNTRSKIPYPQNKMNPTSRMYQAVDEAINERKMKRPRKTRPEELSDLEAMGGDRRVNALLDTNREQRALKGSMETSQRSWENKAIDEAADRQYRSMIPEYGEAEPIDNDRMSWLFEKQKEADRIANGDWQWMLQDVRYKNNPLVAQAVSEIIQRDGLKGLKKDTVSELQKRLDVRTDLKNEKAIKHNRLQKDLEQYQDLEDIVASKFAHKEEGDVAAELMGMNPDTGASMPDNLKQAMEAIALNRGVPVVNEIDDVLNNPFVDEAVKNKRLLAYENRKIPELKRRESTYSVPSKKLDRSNPKWLSREQAISEGKIVPSDESMDIERLVQEAANKDKEFQELRNRMGSDLFEIRNPYEREALVAKYKQRMSELGKEKSRAQGKAEAKTEAFNRRIENQDLGDSDVESVFDQFKDARQLEWEKPEPRFETENALREAEYYKDPVRPTIERRQKEIMDQAVEANPYKRVPVTKYTDKGTEVSLIPEEDAILSRYPEQSRMSEAEKVSAGGVSKPKQLVSQARINMDVKSGRLPKEVADRFGDKLKQMTLKGYNDFMDEMFGVRYQSSLKR